MIGHYAGVDFSVSEDRVQTFREMTRETASRWNIHEVIGTKPLQEFLGPDLDSLSFTMQLTAWRGVDPLGMAQQLRQFCQAGEYDNLILGGVNLGRFVIESISESYQTVTQAGRVLAAQVDVTLKEYQ